MARNYNNLGFAWHKLGETYKAATYIEKAVEILTVVYGGDHPLTRAVKSNLETLKK